MLLWGFEDVIQRFAGGGNLGFSVATDSFSFTFMCVFSLQGNRRRMRRRKKQKAL